MNNVWTSIAFRAPCAHAASRRPLLQLFNGYAKSQSRSYWQTTCRQPCRPLQAAPVRITRPGRPQEEVQGAWKHSFSTTSVLYPRSRPPKTRPPSDSKLEEPQTVASHTEGLPNGTEELTWRDYDPAGGMPLPNGERSQSQISRIFGDASLDADTGNYILSVMHWRRMSGALIDVGLDFPRGSGVSRGQALRALEFVRGLEPGFDEQAAGQVWVEEESLRLQEQLEDRAVKLRLYKRDEPLPEEVEEVEEDQGTAYGRERNRESQLVRIREENEAKFEEEEARRKDTEAKAELAALHTHRGPLELAGGVQPSVELVTYTGPDGITISRPQTSAWLQPVERKEWVKYYEEKAELFKGDTVPNISTLRRLGPSFLMLLLVLSGALYTSETYTPPPHSARIWPDTPPAVATLTALTTATLALFLASRFPPFWRTLNKYFTLVPAYPHSLALLGCTFRHQPFSHLAINTASLWLFGLILHEDVGRGSFLAIYFASGALGAFSSLAFHVLRANWTAYMFGSSGCVLGVVAAACTLHPNSTLKIFGQEVPIAVWLWLVLWGMAEVAAVWKFRGRSVDHLGHLGGLAAGFTGAMVLKKRARVQGEREGSFAERDVVAVS